MFFAVCNIKRRRQRYLLSVFYIADGKEHTLPSVTKNADGIERNTAHGSITWIDDMAGSEPHIPTCPSRPTHPRAPAPHTPTGSTALSLSTRAAHPHHDLSLVSLPYPHAVASHHLSHRSPPLPPAPTTFPIPPRLGPRARRVLDAPYSVERGPWRGGFLWMNSERWRCRWMNRTPWCGGGLDEQ